LTVPATELDEPWRARKRDETDLQWRMRVLQEEHDRRDPDSPLVTPEAEQHSTYERDFVLHIDQQTLAMTLRNTETSPLWELYLRGGIDQDQYGASLEIQHAAEMARADVDMRSASLEARVDNSGSGRDALIERLSQVRLSIAYTFWRSSLPHPPAMILDMILGTGSLKDKARQHRMGWPRGKELLERALDNWRGIRDKVGRDVEEQEVEAIYHKLGFGKLR
jgi:hypothetical protein